MERRAPYGECYDCEPTLSDVEVIEFCKNGYLMLEGVVPEAINRKTIRYLDEVDDSGEPTPIMGQEWFVEGVLKNPLAAGAVRSLLGMDFSLPVIISNHRVKMPREAQGWHRDSGSLYSRKLDHLQVFYYPENCPPEFGPTKVLPGSHFLRIKSPMMANFGHISGTVSTAAPAGSIFLTVYSIWHHRSTSTAESSLKVPIRNMLKYNYWRTTKPKRDWKVDPGFDFSTVDFNPPNPPFIEGFQGAAAAARMFSWLCGLSDQYVNRGGQSWPVAPTVRDGTEQMGIPDGLRKDVR